MKRSCTGLVYKASPLRRWWLSVAGSAMLPAAAAPPTVTPSPGYDARLQEQRAAARPYEPVVREPVWRRRAKRGHGH